MKQTDRLKDVSRKERLYLVEALPDTGRRVQASRMKMQN